MKVRTAVFVTITCLTLSIRAQAISIMPGNDATREAALIMLEVQLRPTLTENNPALKVERSGNDIRIFDENANLKVRIAAKTSSPAPDALIDENQLYFLFAQIDTSEESKSSVVPFKTWSYEALEQIEHADILPPTCPFPRFLPSEERPLTRYQFAVTLLRLLERNGFLENNRLTLDSANLFWKKNELRKVELRAQIEALIHEFTFEIYKLGIRYDANKNHYAKTKKYQYFQIEVSNETQADLKLNEEIKHTVADFAAGYLKLNSNSS